MHRDFHARFLLYWIAIGGLLLTGSGCSFVKVPQGWVLSTGWSLEFHRMPFHVSRERACETGCEVGCTPGCGSNDASPTGESNEPAAAPVPIEPAPTLRKIEEGPAPEVDESAGLMDLLRRRGRLGVCTTCGKMGRFKGSQSPPHPAVQSTMPVVAKFHPVPAAPVFCPQPNAVVARPASFSPPPSKIQPGYNRRMPLPPQPEFVPPPPPAPGDTKYEQAPRELDVPPEPPEWVFTTPRERSEGTSESPSQSKRLGESSTRR